MARENMKHSDRGNLMENLAAGKDRQLFNSGILNKVACFYAIGDEMEHISREQYLERLKGFRYIQNPTPEDMFKICPHLTEDETIAAFTPADGKESIYVALPNLLIRHCFQRASFYRGGGEGSKGQVLPPSLSYSYVSRLPESYADGKSHGDVFTNYPYPHRDRAMLYAEDHWGDKLILDTWHDVIEIYMDDPSQIYPKGSGVFLDGGPITKAAIYFGIDDSFNRISNDHSKPEHELINDHIVVTTLNKFERHEIQGGRGGYTEFNCAYCSAGLGLDHCDGCGHKFTDNHFRCGWCTPLPDKLIDMLIQAGHKFGIDPIIGRQRQLAHNEEERKKWASYFQTRY